MTIPIEAVNDHRLLGPTNQSAMVERAARRRALLRRSATALSVVLGLGTAQAIREVSRTEQSLARDGAAGARVVTSVLEPGLRLRVPVEPNTDVVRLVVHAFGDRSPDPEVHTARLSFHARGSLGSRDESVEVPAPGTSRRAVAEDASVVVYDPMAVNLDVHGIGSGELVMTLESLRGARGLLVRSYRREAVPVLDAIRRRTSLGESKRERLARRAGEADWVDLSTTDRSTLLGARWRRLAPLPDSQQATTWKTISLRAAPPDEASSAPHAPESAVDAPSASAGEAVRYFRVTPERPLVVASSGPPLVLRLSARRPLPNESTAPARIALIALFTKSGSPAVTSTLSAEVGPSTEDRYEVPKDERVPSERAVFHLLVPPAGAVSVSSADGPVDVVLSELDPEASPRPLRPRYGDSEPAPSGEPQALAWKGFVARIPTNASAFAEELSGILRLAPRSIDPKLGTAEKLAVVHAARPARVSSIRRDGYVFVSSEAPVFVQLRNDRPGLAPMRLFSDAPTDVVIRVDGGRPGRRNAFAPRVVTTSRRLRVDGETRATLVLGDDLSSGKHALSFEANPGTRVWVHLPWVRRPGREQRSEWISGDFDR